MLEIQDLVAGYGHIDAVRDVTLHLDRGEAVCLLGMNGAGKTTIVKTLAGWLRPRAGSVRLDGLEITRTPSWERTRRGLAVVPEGGRVFRDLSVEENLKIGKSTQWARGYDLFPLLYERRRQLAGSLSGGQRQMLSLGRALATDPRYLILDEISFGLMPTITNGIFDRLEDLRSQNMGLLVIEQEERRALAFCDRGYVLAHGTLVAEGRSDDLAKDQQVRRAYLGE